MSGLCMVHRRYIMRDSGGIDREFEFYEFFSFLKFNEFYGFFFG